ncbi:uncharacterized protein RHO25_006994 [Cercospora beticola]|uniref:O-methyltransferase C-terminal domain-containing protein n=2 Tax=Cercospora beticola TaxID=122368 RepID=A0ABZ0NS44_CERBT|nr:hypothetical protein RHO25_006994 [Cercospora beticola]
MATSKSQDSVAALAQSLSESVALIAKYHEVNKLPSLSLEADSAQNGSYPPPVEQARNCLISDCQNMQRLFTRSEDISHMHGFTQTAFLGLMRFIFEFRIAQLVPVGGDAKISYGDVAEKTLVRAGVLRQILRAAIAFGMFEEKQQGYIAHSPITRAWVNSDQMSDWFSMLEIGSTGLNNLAPALRKWPEADSPAKSAIMFAIGTGDADFYQYLDRSPSKAKHFAAVMSLYQAGDGYDPRHTVNNFDWSKVNHLVDVGGSTGEIAFMLKKQCPDLQITVQDLPSTIQAVRKQSNVDLQGVNFMEHDFFKPQPVHRADVYMLRWILHNWSDAMATRILQALIPGLKPGATVLIVDEIMPAIGTVPPEIERNQRTLDLTMLTLFNAKVRELEDWKQLVATADSRFLISNITEPEGSRLSLIELQWQG